MSPADYDALESWAVMAAQEAAGNPDGHDQLPGIRMLLADLDTLLNEDLTP